MVKQLMVIRLDRDYSEDRLNAAVIVVDSDSQPGRCVQHVAELQAVL